MTKIIGEANKFFSILKIDQKILSCVYESLASVFFKYAKSEFRSGFSCVKIVVRVNLWAVNFSAN